MTGWLVGLAFILGVAAFTYFRETALRRAARPLSRVDHVVSFPWSVTLTVQRNEMPLLNHSGVYDGLAIQRNQYALALRLINTSHEKEVDPFSLYVPLDQDVLRELATVLTQEANRLDAEGSPHWKR